MEKADFQEKKSNKQIWLIPKEDFFKEKLLLTPEAELECIACCQKAIKEYQKTPVCEVCKDKQIAEPIKFNKVQENINIRKLLEISYIGINSMMYAFQNKEHIVWLDESVVRLRTMPGFQKSSPTSFYWKLDKSSNFKGLKEFLNLNQFHIVNNCCEQIRKLLPKNKEVYPPHSQYIYDNELTPEQRDRLNFSQSDKISIVDNEIMDYDMRDFFIYMFVFMFAPGRIKQALIEICWILEQLKKTGTITLQDEDRIILFYIKETDIYTVLELEPFTTDILLVKLQNALLHLEYSINDYTNWYTDDITQISVLQDLCKEKSITSARELFLEFFSKQAFERIASIITSTNQNQIAQVDPQEVIKLSDECRGYYLCKYELKNVQDVFIEIEFLCNAQDINAQNIYIIDWDYGYKIEMNAVPVSVHNKEIAQKARVRLEDEETKEEEKKEAAKVMSVEDLRRIYNEFICCTPHQRSSKRTKKKGV